MNATLLKANEEYVLQKMNDPLIIWGTTYHEKAEESEILKLNKDNCDEIFGTVNIIEKSRKYADRYALNSRENRIAYVAHKIGMVKGLEMNKDKVFTKKQMYDALVWAASFQGAYQTLNDSYIKNYVDNQMSKIDVTSVDVIIEMEFSPITCFCFDCGKVASAMSEEICKKVGSCYNYVPKHDENDCLILKRL